MLQETVTFDLRHMPRQPSISMIVYMPFLFIVGLVTCRKLIRIWKIALPFKPQRPVNIPDYLQLLKTSTSSLTQWISLTFLCWGIFAAESLYKVCDKLFDEEKIRKLELLFIIQDFPAAFTMTLLVALFVFVVRWHVLKRIENLRT
jgi:hypothetical protein